MREYFMVGERKTSYLDFGGQGEPLLALHGHFNEEASWQARFEAFLENLPQEEQASAGAALRALLEEAARQSGQGASAGAGGLAVGGNLQINAEGGSVAAGVIHGGVSIGHPPVPDPSKG